MNLKKFLHGVAVAALFLIPIFPIIVANSFFFPFITGKAFYFRIVVEVALAAWLILAFLDAKYRPKLTKLNVAVTIFALVALLADVVGLNPMRSIWSNFERMEGWLTIIHLWAFYMVATNVLGHDKDNLALWRKWFIAELGVAFFVGFYSLLQMAGVLAIHQGSSRIDSTLGNSAYMAVYMLINAGIAFFVLHSSRNKWSLKIRAKELWVFWTAFVLTLIVAVILIPSGTQDSTNFFHALGAFSSAHPLQLLFGIVVTVLALIYPLFVLPVFFSVLVYETATRGTFLGLAGGILLALFLYAVCGRKEPKVWRWISTGALVVVVLIGVVFWTNRTSSFVQNHEILNRLASISLNDVKTQARGYIWPMAVKGFTERPILGVGQENFNYIFNSNYNPQMWAQEQWFDRAHNVYLDWLTAGGALGLLAYLSLYVCLLIVLWKSSLTMVEKSALTGLITGYAIHNVFVFDNLASYVLFFTVLAFINGFDKQRPLKLLGQGPVNVDAVEYIVAPIAIILLIASLYFINVRPIQANTRLIQALIACNSGKGDPAAFRRVLELESTTANQETREQILQCAAGVLAGQAPNPLKQEFFQFATEQIQAQIAATPDDARIYTLGGSFMNQTNQYAQAVPLLEKAHTLSQGKQSIDLQLATAYASSEKIPEAEALLKKDFAATPEHPDVRQLYARILILQDKEVEAHKIFGDDPALFQNEGVASMYASKKNYTKALEIYRALVAASPTDATLLLHMAQIQYMAGRISDAVATLQSIEKSHPEYKEQMEAAIKEVQK